MYDMYYPYVSNILQIRSRCDKGPFILTKMTIQLLVDLCWVISMATIAIHEENFFSWQS